MVKVVDIFIFERQLDVFSDQERNVVVLYFGRWLGFRFVNGPWFDFLQFLVQFYFCVVEVTYQNNYLHINFVKPFFLLRFLIVCFVFLPHLIQYMLPVREHVHLLLIDFDCLHNVPLLIHYQNIIFLSVCLVLQNRKLIIFISTEFFNQTQVIVQKFQTDFIMPELGLIVFEHFQNRWFFLIENSCQYLFVFRSELLSIKILDIDFPELVQTLIFWGFWLETWVLIILLFGKDGSVEGRSRVRFILLIFALIFPSMIFFDLLSFSRLWASVLGQSIGVVLFEELFFFHCPLNIYYKAI